MGSASCHRNRRTSGANLREDWPVNESEGAALAQVVADILVPTAIQAQFTAQFSGNLDWNRVILNFSNTFDWQACFPANERTLAFRGRTGNQHWAAVGLCSNVVGLAVFAGEKATGVEALIQHVPEVVLSEITRY